MWIWVGVDMGGCVGVDMGGWVGVCSTVIEPKDDG